MFLACLRLCAWQELSFEPSRPGAARVEAVPVPEDVEQSSVWIVLDLAMFHDVIFDMGPAQSSQLFGRWMSGVDPSRLWGPRRDRVAYCLAELPRLDSLGCL